MIYLDNAATTKPSKSAIDAFLKTVDEFGNPSSLHRLGLNAEKLIRTSKRTIAEKIGVKPETIYFTSGGTESNNLAISGSVAKSRRRHIITSKIEHPSVLEPIAKLEKDGFIIDKIGVDSEGRLILSELEQKLSDDTALVSIMQVNNETGTTQPLEEVRELIDIKAKGALFHIDAVQGFCKEKLNIKKVNPDFMSVSAHKINGFKGTGALYIKDKTKLLPIVYGGGQENGLRSGTENVCGIYAFSEAVKGKFSENDRVLMLRNLLLKGISDNICDIKYNGSKEYFSPYILNVSFLGIRAEILLHALENEGIYVSTGSACSSHKPMPSHVLTALGCTKEEIEGAIRFSFDDNITERDILNTVSVLSEKVKEIRKYMK